MEADPKKTPRDQMSREKTERKKEWKPSAGGALDLPKDGMHYRWVRYRIRDLDRREDVLDRIRQHYEVVPAEELVGQGFDRVEDGKFEGVVKHGDLLLTRVPIEIKEQRDKHYAALTARTIAGIDAEMDRKAHPTMPFERSRRTRVIKGQKNLETNEPNDTDEE